MQRPKRTTCLAEIFGELIEPPKSSYTGFIVKEAAAMLDVRYTKGCVA